MTSKYVPLTNYLKNVDKSMTEVTLTFEKIEEILGFKLPDSAHNHKAWWGNEFIEHSHSQSKAWLSAGWKVKHYDLNRELVTFVKFDT